MTAFGSVANRKRAIGHDRPVGVAASYECDDVQQAYGRDGFHGEEVYHQPSPSTVGQPTPGMINSRLPN